MSPIRWSRMLVAAATLGLIGCARDPDPTHVDARNIGTYTWWYSFAAQHFTPSERRDFDAAIVELRLEASAAGAQGREEIDAALCQTVNGRTTDAVIRLADEGKRRRIMADVKRLKEMVDANALLAAKQGDQESAAELESRRRSQVDRLAAMLREIDGINRHLVAHGGSAVAPTVDTHPAALPRSEAIRQWRDLITARLQLARDVYGDWPARIDRIGSELNDQDRADFEQRQREAEINGHVVIPVYIRYAWRIYDAPPAVPEFTAAVTANLTPEDKQALEHAWTDSDAEIWARKGAMDDRTEDVAARIRAALGNMKP